MKDCICGHTYDEHYVRDSDGARVCVVSVSKDKLCRCLRYAAPKSLGVRIFAHAMRPLAVVAVVFGIGASDAQANTLTCHHAKVLIGQHWHLSWPRRAAVGALPCHRRGEHLVRVGRYRVRYDPDWYFPYQRVHYRRCLM